MSLPLAFATAFKTLLAAIGRQCDSGHHHTCMILPWDPLCRIPDSKAGGGGGGISSGAVAGIVVGIVAVVLLAVVLLGEQLL